MARGADVQIPEDEAAGALRRAVLLLAAGGDPHRALELDGRAVTGMAVELDSPERRAALARGLDGAPVRGGGPSGGRAPRSTGCSPTTTSPGARTRPG